jgi:hypothetical protein
MLLFTACSTEEAPIEKVSGTNEEIAASYIIDFTQQNLDNLLTRYTYDDKMDEAMSKEVLLQVYEQLEGNYGNYKETGEAETIESGVYIIVSYLTYWEGANLNINIVFDGDSHIAGFNYTEALEEMVAETEIIEKEVQFGEEPFVLSGTLSIPAGEGPFPAVVLIHGSGPSNRDEAFQELAPFKDIANYLTDRGIAVLRFDKRTFTYGASIDPETFTAFEESIEDAGFAYDFLTAQNAINVDQIFILGHSLGGYLMPKIATYVPDAAGYIITAGSARPLEDLIVEQYTYIYGLDGGIDATEQANIDILLTQQENIKTGADLPAAELMGAHPAYWAYFSEYDPMTDIKSIDKPILLQQGEGDYQVTMDDFDLWAQATQDMPKVTRITYPLINHFLYQGEGTPSPQQYQSPDHVDSQLMDDMIEFIKKSTLQ